MNVDSGHSVQCTTKSIVAAAAAAAAVAARAQAIGEQRAPYKFTNRRDKEMNLNWIESIEMLSVYLYRENEKTGNDSFKHLVCVELFFAANNFYWLAVSMQSVHSVVIKTEHIRDAVSNGVHIIQLSSSPTVRCWAIAKRFELIFCTIAHTMEKLFKIFT